VNRRGLALDRDQAQLVPVAQEQRDRAREGSSAAEARHPGAQVPSLERAAVQGRELAALERAAQAPAEGPAQALEHPQAKAPILARNQGAVYCSEDQADPAAEGREEADRGASGQADLVGLAQAAAKDQATRGATSRPGPARTKTSSEF
jgi:hypothetical protein